MVDLHDSLRPTGTVPPLPVSEIAIRGKRRKRRRLASTTGVAVATMGIAAFVISTVPWSPTDTVTVADGTHQDSTTSIDPPATSTTSEAPASAIEETTPVEDTELTTSSTTSSTSTSDTSADASAEIQPLTTPGIRTNTTRTSEWEDGYCIQVEVINDNADRSDWQVVLDLDGTIATIWNATVVNAGAGFFVFSGEDGYNDNIGAGTDTSFGTCVDTNVD